MNISANINCVQQFELKSIEIVIDTDIESIINRKTKICSYLNLRSNSKYIFIAQLLIDIYRIEQRLGQRVFIEHSNLAAFLLITHKVLSNNLLKKTPNHFLIII